MNKEDFKVGMKIKWSDTVFEVVDTKYIDHLVVLKHTDCDLLIGVNSASYKHMEEIKPIPKIDGVLAVAQCKRYPRQIIAKFITENFDVIIGIAKCNPEDNFDFEFGANLAIQRCLQAKKEYEEWLAAPSKGIGDKWVKQQGSYKAYLDYIKKGNKK